MKVLFLGGEFDRTRLEMTETPQQFVRVVPPPPGLIGDVAESWSNTRLGKEPYELHRVAIGMGYHHDLVPVYATVGTPDNVINYLLTTYLREGDRDPRD
jgi:hypothetical protein